jgi:hypothetical protein
MANMRGPDVSGGAWEAAGILSLAPRAGGSLLHRDPRKRRPLLELGPSGSATSRGHLPVHTQSQLWVTTGM